MEEIKWLEIKLMFSKKKLLLRIDAQLVNLILFFNFAIDPIIFNPKN